MSWALELRRLGTLRFMYCRIERARVCGGHHRWGEEPGGEEPGGEELSDSSSDWLRSRSTILCSCHRAASALLTLTPMGHWAAAHSASPATRGCTRKGCVSFRRGY